MEQAYYRKWYRPSQLFPGQARLAWLIPFNMLSHLCWKLDEYSITQILPYVQDQYGISALDAQWYSTAYYLASAGSAIPLGKLGEKIGQPAVIIGCLAFYAVFELLTFFSTAYWQLLILRALTGFSIAGMVSNKNALLTKYPSKENSGKSISISLIINNLVIVFIPYVCGATIDSIGWRWNMIFASATAALCIATLLFFYNNPFPVYLKFDIAGSLLLMLTVASFCSIFVLLARYLYVAGGVMVPACVLLLVLFMFVEKRVKDPVLPPYLMKNPIIDLFAAYAINYINVGGVLFIYPQAMSILGKSATTVGTVTTISGAGLFLMSFVIPWLYEKVVNSVIVAFLNFLAIVFTALQIAFYNDFYWNSVTFALQNIVYMSVMVVTYKTLLISVPQRYASRVSGLPTTGRTVGNSISLCVYSSVAAVMQSILIQNKDAKMISFYVCGGFVIFFSLIYIVIMLFRVGNSDSERGYLFFAAKRVHDIKLPQSMDGDIPDSAVAQQASRKGVEPELIYDKAMQYI